MKNSHFFHLILLTTRNQAKALLETANKYQVLEIVKIIYNLNKNQQILLPKTKNLLNKHKSLISKLTHKNNTDKKNYTLIVKNWIKILNLISSSKNILLKVIT